MFRLSENPVRISAAEFTREQRQFLLAIARASIASALIGDPLPDSSPTAPFPFPALSAPRGVFTTLYLEGELRGCVGYPLATHALFRAVAETARAAAFEDSRFPSVTPEEAPGLQVSLSILSPLSPIAAGDVEIGRHGLLVTQGLRRGLLLPQVPVEHGWDRETFLAQTCRKAGLPSDAWRNSATIEAFTAEVFGDEDVR
ncbi:MAG TPA: AmmeMemoRadiSam system protein A [Candidatus Saccharimonadales bacterium]|nr:AmmeMemoRadiSam system protein A [Candidatus Saccharimonadales bacterium]